MGVEVEVGLAAGKGCFFGAVVDEGGVRWARTHDYIASISHISVFPHPRPRFSGLGCTAQSVIQCARSEASQLLPHLLLAAPTVFAHSNANHLVDAVGFLC